MPDSAFVSTKNIDFGIGPEDDSILNELDSPSRSISYGSILAPLEPPKKQVVDSKSPYQRFLAKKRRVAITKLLFFLIVVIGMTIWFLLMQKGR